MSWSVKELTQAGEGGFSRLFCWFFVGQIECVNDMTVDESEFFCYPASRKDCMRLSSAKSKQAPINLVRSPLAPSFRQGALPGRFRRSRYPCGACGHVFTQRDFYRNHMITCRPNHTVSGITDSGGYEPDETNRCVTKR